MNSSNNEQNILPAGSKIIVILFLILGILVGGGIVFTITQLIGNTDEGVASTADEPLYWVAPMDPNFRRDQPGQSPMGMDLVPVYATDNSNDSAGTITIEPNMINNLGVKTTQIEEKLLISTISVFGQVAQAQDSINHIHPRVSGWIETLKVHTAGEYIEQGAPLYSLYSPELVNAQEALVIAVQQNNKLLINAAKTRLVALNVPLTFITTIINTQQIQREVMFYAPQSGYVNEISVQEGFYVTPNKTLLVIGSLDTVWVDVDVFAQDAVHLKLNQAALITVDYLPNQQFDGTVDYIYPTLDPVTKSLRARIVLDNLEHQLKPNMFANVMLVNDQNVEPQLTVPRSAVIRTGTQDRVVIALGQGKFKSVAISLAGLFNEEFVVVDGLEAGDTIVTSAQFLLDSESSINSDFVRMSSVSSPSAWTHATVNEIMHDERLLNLTHGPLDEFSMMGMTMDFMLADDIDLDTITLDMEIHVEIVQDPSGMLLIKTIHNMDHDMSEER